MDLDEEDLAMTMASVRPDIVNIAHVGRPIGGAGLIDLDLTRTDARMLNNPR